MKNIHDDAMEVQSSTRQHDLSSSSNSCRPCGRGEGGSPPRRGRRHASVVLLQVGLLLAFLITSAQTSSMDFSSPNPFFDLASEEDISYRERVISATQPRPDDLLSPSQRNGSSSSEGRPAYMHYEPGFWSFITLMFCGVMVILTVVGNICVIAAVHQSKALQAPQNALIVSLALADLLVGLAVMPFAAITDFLGLWILGAIPCDIWTVLDVCLCTASILHLVAIAFDRYFSITNMRYIQGRNVKLMYVVIATVWILSLVLAVGPAMGWRDNLYDERIERGECLVSQEVSFQIFGTSVAFFGPLVGILILYGLIYQQTRSRMRKRMEDTLHSTLHQIAKVEKDAASAAAANNNNNHSPSNASTPPSTPTSTTTNGLQLASLFQDGKWTSRFRTPRPFRRSLNASVRSQNNNKMSTPQRKCSRGGSTQTIRLSELGAEENEATIASSLHLTDDTLSVCPSYSDQPEKAKLRVVKKPSTSLSARHQTLLRREKKAATTLAIITLSFVVCWLPFFLYAVVRPVCGESCQLPHTAESFFLWLGYANSTLNPLIYTIFSPDFRNAFKKLFRLDSSPPMT
ncbi:5-hydroxytryptamine receptor 1A [Hypsibius exemplaris]|uniref:5-hydroxytryptamine receptor 1A n=1 Tax=Hypsibius exemplaris TaxID=2072580 RepID=A0A1W0X629_HYPEX|nr:5-hydroxytryptamine receptor 1A [Hypsibius exemplaris]